MVRWAAAIAVLVAACANDVQTSCRASPHWEAFKSAAEARRRPVGCIDNRAAFTAAFNAIEPRSDVAVPEFIGAEMDRTRGAVVLVFYYRGIVRYGVIGVDDFRAIIAKE